MLQAIVNTVASEVKKSMATDAIAASTCPIKLNNPLTTAVNGLRSERETGFGPATSSLGS